MPEEQVGQIRIGKRLIQIGHQVYPLAALARVQTLRTSGARLATAGEVVTFLLVVFAALFLLPVYSGDYPVTPTTVLVLAVLVAAVVLIYRAVTRRRRYVLLIEAAGGQYTALVAAAAGEIQWLRDEIAGAIENPPEQERVLQLVDIVMGDKFDGNKYTQSGTGNTFTA